jgi:serine/threonine protein kinase
MTDRVGQQLGNYRLTRLLGAGGFAEVYLGEHIYLNTTAAIKLLHTQLDDQFTADYFLNEARTIAQLVHPNIVRTLDFGIEGGITPFLVMDYAPNGTLRARHPRNSRVPLPQVVTYVKEMASALQYAHDRKLVHRDVKPENMLVGRNNEILLSDFGIAVVAQTSRSQSEGDIAGTVAYMAPEQIQAHPRPASDQYSLATVAYEWLSGEVPFNGTWTEIVIKQTSAQPEPLRKRVQLSPQVDAVIMRALAKDPAQRFGSVREFAQALEEASTGIQRAFSATTVSDTAAASPDPAAPPEVIARRQQIGSFQSEPGMPGPFGPGPAGITSYNAPTSIANSAMYSPSGGGPYAARQQQTSPYTPHTPQPMPPGRYSYQAQAIPGQPGSQPYSPQQAQEERRKNNFPLVRGGCSALFIMLGYSALFLFALYTLASFSADFSYTIHHPSNPNLAFAILLPAGALLGGKVLGGGRGMMSMLLSIAAVMALSIFQFHIFRTTEIVRYGRYNQLSVFLNWLGLPLAALIMGWFYKFRRSQSYLFSAFTSLLGSVIIGIGMAGIYTFYYHPSTVVLYAIAGTITVFILETILDLMAWAAQR